VPAGRVAKSIAQVPFDGMAKTAPRPEVQMQEKQHHHNARALHDVDMQSGARKPAQIEEQLL
jgi:hypothetical protein